MTENSTDNSYTLTVRLPTWLLASSLLKSFSAIFVLLICGFLGWEAVTTGLSWLRVNHLDPVGREDVVGIAGLVLNVASVVVASFFIVTLYLLYQSNSQRSKVEDRIAIDEKKLQAMEDRLDKLKDPKEIEEVLKIHVEKKISDLKRLYTPAKDLKSEISDSVRLQLLDNFFKAVLENDPKLFAFGLSNGDTEAKAEQKPRSKRKPPESTL